MIREQTVRGCQGTSRHVRAYNHGWHAWIRKLYTIGRKLHGADPPERNSLKRVELFHPPDLSSS